MDGVFVHKCTSVHPSVFGSCGSCVFVCRDGPQWSVDETARYIWQDATPKREDRVQVRARQVQECVDLLQRDGEVRSGADQDWDLLRRSECRKCDHLTDRIFMQFLP